MFTICQGSKKALFFIAVIFSLQPLWSFELDLKKEYDGRWHKITFTCNSFEYINIAGLMDHPNEIKISNYCLISEYGLTFLCNELGEKELLLLGDEDLLLVYSKDSNKRLFFADLENRCFETFWSYDDLSATSFLVENDIKYEPWNIRGKLLSLPWVEGVSGQGIGEKLTFPMSFNAKGICIYNGFISFDKPELYVKNSRVKSFIIRDLETGNEVTWELLDKPDPQYIMLESFANHNVELEILEVYPGTRYEDTCIAGLSLIYPDGCD